MADSKLLKVRAQIKKSKPTFKRVQSNQFAKLKNKGASWRKPKGMGNKVRRQRRGQPIMPKVGFGSPKAVKGLNRDGFKEVLVSNIEELTKVDVKTSVAIIARTVGAKKKLEILNKAKSEKISIGNVKDIDAEIKKLSKTDSKKKSQAKTPKKEEKVESKNEKKEDSKK